LSRLRAQGKTIVTVTHDFEMAFERSDHLIVMDKGKKAHEGDVHDVLPALLETEMASMLPELVRLTALLRSRGFGVPLTWKLSRIIDTLGSMPKKSF
jgi:ABC-type glutathione transport system ATPase component